MFNGPLFILSSVSGQANPRKTNPCKATASEKRSAKAEISYVQFQNDGHGLKNDP